MLLATEYALDDEAKTSTSKNQVTFKKVIEIRIPDIMMSDEYLGAITEPDRKNVRIIFVNSMYKYLKQFSKIIKKQNEKVTGVRGADNNVVVLDEYRIVLCSKNETIRNRFEELIAIDQASAGGIDKMLTLSDELYNFILDQTQNDKRVYW
jgi:hypothetical protein